MTPRDPLFFWLTAAEVVRWWETTTWVMPAALELRGEQKVPLQVFVGTCSGTPRTLSRMCPGQELEERSARLKPGTHRVPVRTRIMMQTDGECACASAMFLEGSRTGEH